MTQEIYTAVMVPSEAIPMVEAAPQQPPRPIPVSTFQLVGQTTQDVVSGISKTPLMLGVILLNVAGIAAAVYFLNVLISGQQQHLGNLLTLQTNNLNTVIETHNREFDALMALNAKVTEALAAERNVPPTPAPVPAPAPPTPSRR
jgi:hypothetical protein